jgi:drug/metabolite transporter (DMT)-like permease
MLNCTMGYASQKQDITQHSTFITQHSSLNPITTMIFASLVLDEKITPYFLAGACCILAGMYIADRMTKAE